MSRLIVAVLAVATMSAETVYVSPHGKQGWSGKLPAPNATATDGPLPDLNAARDRIRTLRRSGVTGNMSVILRGGTYFLPDTFLLTPEDSDTAYVAYKGELPIVSGGEIVTGWKPGKDALWTAVVPGHFRQLFVDGSRAQRARTPNEGFLRMEGPSSQEKPFVMRYRGNEVHKNWEGSNVEIVGLLNWAEMRMKVRSVDEASHTARLSANPSQFNKVQNERFWIENSLEALDEPGEWYHDEQTSVLTYWPLSKDNFPNHEFIVPRLITLVSVQGRPEMGMAVRNVSFKGIEFRHADWSMPADGFTDTQAAMAAPTAFEAFGAEKLSIDHCTFDQLGGYAIWLHRGSKNDRIVSTKIYDVGGGGIRIGETVNIAAPSQQSSGNVVSDNEMHDLDLVYPGAIGVWIGQSSGNTISHNHIHDLFYTAISVGWTYKPTASQCHDNVVEYNDLHDIGKRFLSDMGAIYTLGSQPGTVIRYNRIHDVFSFSYNGVGIYTDAGSSNLTIENNVVYHSQDGYFHQTDARDNLVQNNIFAFCTEFQLMCPRGTTRQSSLRFERNIVAFDTGRLEDGLWSPWPFSPDRNVYWCSRGQQLMFDGKTWQQWQGDGRDRDSLYENPRFLNADNYDLRISSSSPALAIGFRPIDLSTVGPRTAPGAEALTTSLE